MMKSLFGLIAAAAVATSLAGCTPSAPEAAATPPAPPAPAAAPQPPPPPPPMAQAVSPRQHIEDVQTALNANGAHLVVDGRMGPKTRAALRGYQHRHHLRVTGRIDSETLSALGVQS
jgi:peptidoglycan hydrolase-like protein with peptidoglycan-binding domain